MMMTRIRMAIAAIALFPLFAACAARQDVSTAQLYSGFTRIDPETERRIEQSWLVVRDGRIAAMGSGAPPRGEFAVVHELPGRYAMPGLIDAHAHLVAGPQAVTRKDGKPRIEIRTGDEYSRINGAVALAFGITSARNPGGSAAAAKRYDERIASGEWPGPRARHAGDILQPPTLMAGESFAYPRTPQEWDAEAARQKAAGMTFFKLYTDLTESEIAQGVAAAKAHGLVPIAHLNAVSWKRAAELGVRQLEHALPTSPELLEPTARAQYVAGPDFMTRWWELADLRGPVMRETIETLRARGVVVNLTLLVNQIIYFAGEWETVFPEMAGGLPDYVHPDMEALLANYQAMASVPPEQLARGRAVWPKVLEFARLLHEAGVPLTIGTDGAGGGSSYAHELHNHVLAGIPAWAVLRIATSGNAERIGLGDTGRLAPGMRADIVFLRADPSVDVRNVGQIELVVAGGRTRRPQALLDIARGIAAEARKRAVAKPAGN
jgi:imidazolonepropionase-like amidohydrolase